MTDKETHRLAVYQSGALQAAESSAGGVLSAMVSDALTLAKARSGDVVVSRYRIGKHELCHPDYRQILLWAKVLAIEAIEVIDRLEQCLSDHPQQELWAEPLFVNGVMLKLVWNFEVLPMWSFEWVDGLEIRQIEFTGNASVSPTLALRLPRLSRLDCSFVDLKVLDLANVPQLTQLDCTYNQITTLDLSGVPELSEICCCYNDLTEVNLSQVPKLFHLDCHGNKICRLDLSNVADLMYLWCGDNAISELALVDVPLLTDLRCEHNRLEELDLSNSMALTTLDCSHNRLTHIDISKNYFLDHFDADPGVLVKKRPDQKVEDDRYVLDTD